MEEKPGLYSKIRLILLVALIVLSIGTLSWVVAINGSMGGMNDRIAQNQSAISSMTTKLASITDKLSTLEATRLSSNISVSLPSLSSTYVSVQPVSYTLMLNKAPLTINSSETLSTVVSTNLESFKSILEANSVYEITEASGTYYLAYPANFNKTYSIQMLSSPYPDRVLNLVQQLRGLGLPAFKIDYASQSGLFIGVFNTYSAAEGYAQTISSSAVINVVGSGSSNWMPRTIP